MVFYIISTAVIFAAFIASIHQHFIQKCAVKPKWVYRLHNAAAFAFAYLIIQFYNPNVFLFSVALLLTTTKIYDVIRSRRTPRKQEVALVTEYARDMWLFVLLFWALRTFIADYSPIPSGSMEPGLVAGDVILINKLSYNVKVQPFDEPLYQFSTPSRGDVVVFNPPTDKNAFWIKRVIAVGGDRLEYRNKQYFVNGKPYQQSNKVSNFKNKYAPLLTVMDENIDGKVHKIQTDNRQFNDPIDIIVPQGYLFVSGDNRDFSYDSRMIGPIPATSVVGQATHLITQFKLPTILSFSRSGKIY